MSIDLSSFILGVVVGAIVAVAFSVPRVGRVIAAIMAILMVTGGVGLLGWAVSTVSSEQRIDPISWGPLAISSAAEAFGGGAGLLVGGLIALVLSLRGLRRSPKPAITPPPIRL